MFGMSTKVFEEGPPLTKSNETRVAEFDVEDALGIDKELGVGIGLHVEVHAEGRLGNHVQRETAKSSKGGLVEGLAILFNVNGFSSSGVVIENITTNSSTVGEGWDHLEDVIEGKDYLTSLILFEVKAGETRARTFLQRSPVSAVRALLPALFSSSNTASTRF